MLRRVTVTLALVFASALVCACASGPAAHIEVSPLDPATSGAPTTALRVMTIEERRSLVASSFPIEVPLPFGEVVRGEAQGPNAWDYEIEVEATPAAVAEWYRTAYTGRDWGVIDQTATAEGSIALKMMKNRAQTRVAISPQNGGKVRVKGVLGLGVPVLQTQ